MGTVFWDVDTQQDFMRSSGKLYVPGSEEIIPVLRKLTEHAHARGIRIVASADDHVPGHRELSATPDWRETFPEHCMRGTPGQRKIEETTPRNPLVIEPEPQDPIALAARVRAHDGDILFHKHWFDVFTNPNVLPVVDALAPERIVLYGVALDVCDKYAVEGLLRLRPGIALTVLTDAVRAIHPATGVALLEDWGRRGVRLASSADILTA
ncbi:MAG TPA: cysteine hydrolase family protein [Gemmatimonadales bacterium]|jgi:nicotinamidase/pyrazinamidase|nr:cysteine hydrolase family protein [Gemmatimonadales bacterium]